MGNNTQLIGLLVSAGVFGFVLGCFAEHWVSTRRLTRRVFSVNDPVYLLTEHGRIPAVIVGVRRGYGNKWEASIKIEGADIVQDVGFDGLQPRTVEPAKRWFWRNTPSYRDSARKDDA